MTKYTSYKILDEVLEGLRQSTHTTPIPSEVVFTKFPELLVEERNRDRSNILTKLLNDGYIGEMELLHPPTFGYYITYEGILLLERGGYVEKLKKDKRNSSLKAVQTWAIAIGTLLAALFSILSYFNIH